MQPEKRRRRTRKSHLGDFFPFAACSKENQQNKVARKVILANAFLCGKLARSLKGELTTS